MYYKGANMLHTLRQIINSDEKWRSILVGLNKDFYHQTVTTQQIENYIDSIDPANYCIHEKLFSVYNADEAYKEILKTIHPNAVLTSKIGTKVIDAKIAEKVWGFFSIYVFIFMFLLLAMLGTGLDFESAFSAVGACLNNLGPGLGEVAENYTAVSGVGKLILCFAMILGRLEIFTLLVLFTPAFWRR